MKTTDRTPAAFLRRKSDPESSRPEPQRSLFSSFLIKMLVVFASYLLFVSALACVMALLAGLQEGILNFDQYFDSNYYRQRVRSMMTEMIQRGPETWEVASRTGNLRFVLVDANDQVVATNLGAVRADAGLEAALQELERVNGATDFVSGEATYFLDPSVRQRQTIRYTATVDRTLPAADIFRIEASQYHAVKPVMRLALSLILPSLLLFMLALGYLIRTTGRQTFASPVKLSFIDAVPLDLLTVIGIVGIWQLSSLAWIYGRAWIYDQNFNPLYSLLMFAVYTLPMYMIGLVWLLSCTRRIATNTLWNNTILHLLSERLRQDLPAAFSIALRFLIFIAVNILIVGLVPSWPLSFVLFVLFNGAVMLYLSFLAAAWTRIDRTARAIAEGDLSAKTDERLINRNLRPHAQTINQIGEGLNLEVARRVRSDRMQTDLIANVSHDIKTPLTAIINYVGLLRKSGISAPEAADYLDALSRNADRLRLLTNDLVDFSRFSTGSVQIEPELLDLTELLRQGYGEYAERIAVCNLDMQFSLPEESIWVRTDGRYLWRIIDNLLNNLVKFAQPGSRVYSSLQRSSDGEAVWTQKNISASPLNIAADELTERFVRGDLARNDEGSGLGLAIARSLATVLGGRLVVAIDGDLFRTDVHLPLENM